MQFIVLLLPILILWSWARLFRPSSNEEQGHRQMVVRLPLLARLRMHALPSLAIIGLAMFVAIDKLVDWRIMIVPVISVLVMILYPVKYTITDTGIRLGHTRFHRWTEFSGVRRAPGGAKLIGIQRSLGMRIWLSGSRGDDEFLQFLRQSIRNAYKGRSDILRFPVSSADSPDLNADMPGERSSGVRISAMTTDVT